MSTGCQQPTQLGRSRATSDARKADTLATWVAAIDRVDPISNHKLAAHKMQE
jgi:hypothetical protein